MLQGLQLYARAHALVEAEAQVQHAQARRVSGTPSSGELARARAPGTPPPAARLSHSALHSRPGSAPAAQGLPTALQHPHAAHALQRLAEDPGKAAPVPGPWPGSAAAWATQPPAYPTAAAALVRCASKRRGVSPGATPRGRRDAHGAERQVLEPIQPASRQAVSGLLPRIASREAAGPACQRSRRPGNAPGSMMSGHGARAEPHGGFHAAVAWRAATAMGTSRDPEHRQHIDRVRRQMLCAGPGLPARRTAMRRSVRVYAAMRERPVGAPSIGFGECGMWRCRRKQLAYLRQLLAEATGAGTGRMTSREFQAMPFF